MGLPFNIAIDGHSSCGKSTIAKNIAIEYKMRYIDTGAMYRGVTLFFMRNNILADNLKDMSFLEDMLKKTSILSPMLNDSRSLTFSSPNN